MKMPRFKGGQPLLSQVTASNLNAMANAIQKNTPRFGKGTILRRYSDGFSYSTKPGSENQSIKLGFTVSRAGSGYVRVSESVISGASTIAAMPKIDSDRLDAETAPRLTVTPDTEAWICLKVEITPQAELLSDGETYGIRAGGGTVEGDILVEAYYSESQMNEIAHVAQVNDEGETTNGVFVIPIAKINAQNAITNLGYYKGPLGISLCSNGTLNVQGPVIVIQARMEP